MEKGNLSINSENFLPIIKKWLYTDKDIFVRELVSNGCDAITKLKKLMVMGEADHIPMEEDFRVTVHTDPDKNIIQIVDNGIGMTAEEVKKYINQIAFSGANDFLAKFAQNAEKTEDDKEIIGHFGLGFYSAFMVAEKVEIDTLSYLPGEQPAHWSCTGGIEYEMKEGERTERGTTITLFMAEEEREFTNEWAMRMALKKYCDFMPFPIWLDVTEPEKDMRERIERNERIFKKYEEDSEKAKAEGKTPPTMPYAYNGPSPEQINNPEPLWLKKPSECSGEQYIAFYHEVFDDMNDPLFWIHLNMDYPFRLKGILYFPRMISDLDTLEGKVKLYSNQVFIADNIKEVIPEFLLLLKGVVDCPDLPLNVSRSQLQNDGYSRQMSGYITKKVADKLKGLFKNERESFENFWSDINLFIKYGCMKEDKFYDKIAESLIFRTTEDKYMTINEYLEKYKERLGEVVYFASDVKQQSQYINLFKAQDIAVVVLPDPIDRPFINYIEAQMDGKPAFKRVDADISGALKNETDKPEEEKTAETQKETEFENLFRGIIGENELKVKTEALKTDEISAVMLLSEDSRRMMEIRDSYKGNDPILKMLGEAHPETTLVLNTNNSLIKTLERIKGEESRREDTELLCRQIYDLALMAHKPLTSDEMTRFIARSNKILSRMADSI